MGWLRRASRCGANAKLLRRGMSEPFGSCRIRQWRGYSVNRTCHRTLPRMRQLIAAANQCHSSPQCATVHSLGISPPPPISIGFLYQNLDASPFLGQTLVYRALVRVDPSFGGVGRLLVRVHRKDCSTTFRDGMGDHPVISGEWGAYEIRAPIAMDAYQIEFGVQLVGTGAVWIDQISIEFKSAHGNRLRYPLFLGSLQTFR